MGLFFTCTSANSLRVRLVYFYHKSEEQSGFSPPEGSPQGEAWRWSLGERNPRLSLALMVGTSFFSPQVFMNKKMAICVFRPFLWQGSIFLAFSLRWGRIFPTFPHYQGRSGKSFAVRGKTDRSWSGMVLAGLVICLHSQAINHISTKYVFASIKLCVYINFSLFWPRAGKHTNLVSIRPVLPSQAMNRNKPWIPFLPCDRHCHWMIQVQIPIMFPCKLTVISTPSHLAQSPDCPHKCWSWTMMLIMQILSSVSMVKPEILQFNMAVTVSSLILT